MRHISFLGFQPQDARLVLNLLAINIRDRYLGSMLGLVWAVLNPVLFLGMYTFVFAFIFRSKPSGADTTLAYVIWLITGLVPYQAVAEGFSVSANSVVAGASLVKNLVFKTETLPLAAVLTAAVPLSVGLVFVLALLVADGNYPSWHVVWLLPTLGAQFLCLAGFGLLLAATTVFFRDLLQALTTVTTLILFLTPIFYPLEQLPGPLQKLTFYNPFYQMIVPYRDALVFHRSPDWQGLLYLLVFGALTFVVGLWYFRRLKGYFETAL